MFEFAWPWVFILAPLPWFMRLWLSPQKPEDAAIKISFLTDLQSLQPTDVSHTMFSHQWIAKFWPVALYVFIWMLLLCAAARPQWVGDVQEMPATGRDLMIAADTSGSMENTDMFVEGHPINRLEMIKKLMGDFIASRQGDRVGLILFGSRAYLQAPLTFDRTTVGIWLAESRIGMAGKNTAIGDAIGLAVKRLKGRPAKSRIVILITDGANTDGAIAPLDAAKLAASQNVKVYTIGIGSDANQREFLNPFASNMASDIDEDTLRQIAKLTGGQFFRARTTEELQEINQTIDQLEPVEQKVLSNRPIESLHAWPLGVAFLLTLLVAICNIGFLHLVGKQK